MNVASLAAALPWPRLRLGGVTSFLAGVLLLAGAIHIVTILLVPALARNDGWSRLAAHAGVEQFAEIPVTGRQANVGGLDPLFVNGACRLQISDTPVELLVEAGDRFWSLALYDPRGTIVFSLNDRTAVAGRLDMLVVTPTQNTALRYSPPPDIEQMIVVESPADDLIALLRLFAPTPADQARARDVLVASLCVPMLMGQASGSGG